MMETARSLGLAACFAGGYIFVPGTDDTGTMGSGGATHAGRIGFDPTNHIIGNRIPLGAAVAWDRRPFIGTGEKEMAYATKAWRCSRARSTACMPCSRDKTTKIFI
jgi:hypothetical protein